MAYVISPKAARALTRLVRGSSDATAPTYKSAAISPDDFPPPFTVRWAQSENNGRGAWVIWLNSGSTHGLVMVDGTLKAITHGITAATGLPTGWFTMDDVAPLVTRVWLCYGKPKGTAPEVLRITNSGLIEDVNYVYTSVCVATMSINTATGERRVRQRVRSVVTLTSGGGGSVTLDDVSTDHNDNDEVQIKDWDTGTPASATTIAQDINNPPSNPSALVERDHNGELKYKGLGTLAQLTGSYLTGTQTKTVVINVEWNTTNHTFDITKATVTIKDGVILNWVEDVAPTPIQTTSFALLMARA